MSVTICIPYYERLPLLMRTLESFEKCGYYDKGITVSLVDDGSTKDPIPTSVSKRDGISVCYLPKKTKWMNASVPLNLAVRKAEGDVILLQSPETYHPEPIIDTMLGCLKDPKDVVLSNVAAENNRHHKWYIHPVHRPAKYWFCCMLRKEFFWSLGGFDEGYRAGQGHEDNDFCLSVDLAGGKWVWSNTTAVHVCSRRPLRPGHKHGRKRFEERLTNLGLPPDYQS